MNENNLNITKEYFEGLSAEYVNLIVDSQKQIYRNINPVLTRRVRGRTLCIGSGPVMNFADTNATHVVCADISFNMLTKLPSREKISRVNADARALPFDIGTFDVVVVPFLMHHMAMDSVIETDKTIEKLFGEACRVLRRNGRLVIVDLFISPFLEAFERSFYGPAVYFLHLKRRPMMYFYSIDNIVELLANARLGVSSDNVIEMQEKIMPTLLFPKFKVSPKLHPAKFHIIEAGKIL